MRTVYLHIARLVTFLIALQILNLNFCFADTAEEGAVFTTAPSTQSNTNTLSGFLSKVAVIKIKTRANREKPSRHLQSHKHLTVKLINCKKPAFALNAADRYAGKKHSFIIVRRDLCFREICDPPPLV